MQKTPEDQLPHPSRIAVRVNTVYTPVFERDIVSIVRFPIDPFGTNLNMLAAAAAAAAL